ncbi:hypothetical protein AB0A77_28470 [Streptomyces varsoviensis]|uniref:hypothetical protein n=1 Tax=Streptomyces varsoviensis TaxID=67373 RepID=UPI0033C8A443
MTTQHPYGNPEEWDGEMPDAFVEALCDRLDSLGWSVVDANETYVEIALSPRATGLPEAAARDDRFSTWFHGGSLSFYYGTHPEEHSGHFANPDALYADITPDSVAEQVDHVLRTGSPGGKA